jgi:Oxidoreductase molybdopterin binding domain
MGHMRTLVAALALVATVASAQAACPIDGAVPAGTVLIIRSAGAAQHLSFADLAALPSAERVQRRTLASAGAASAPAQELSLRYGGVLLRDVLARALTGDASGRAMRAATIEALATDGYRAAFSWGELFNSTTGDQVLVITTQDGVPLSTEQGPLALRALADLRPGPRHVRNLCALVVRVPGSAP